MSFIAYVLPVLWLIAGVLALSFVIRPNPRLPIVATRGRALGVLGGVIAVAVVVGLAMPKKAAAPALGAAPPVRTTPLVADVEAVRAHPETYLTLESVTSFHKSDGSVLLTGAVVNNTVLPIRAPALSCKMAQGAAAAGTVSAMIQDTVPSGGRLIFAAINMGKATGPWDRQACTITGATAG